MIYRQIGKLRSQTGIGRALAGGTWFDIKRQAAHSYISDIKCARSMGKNAAPLYVHVALPVRQILFLLLPNLPRSTRGRRVFGGWYYAIARRCTKNPIRPASGINFVICKLRSKSQRNNSSVEYFMLLIYNKTREKAKETRSSLFILYYGSGAAVYLDHRDYKVAWSHSMICIFMRDSRCSLCEGSKWRELCTSSVMRGKAMVKLRNKGAVTPICNKLG